MAKVFGVRVHIEIELQNDSLPDVVRAKNEVMMLIIGAEHGIAEAII